MIKPDGVQRGLVIDPVSFSLFSVKILGIFNLGFDVCLRQDLMLSEFRPCFLGF
uniref:Uncharacterized protein n=1 Tax=Arundo donax TaxID=35708 RepID=A0A0A8ZKR5_ARUDO